MREVAPINGIVQGVCDLLRDLLWWQRNASSEQPRSRSADSLTTNESSEFSDPVYKKNLQRLIERNRENEETRKSEEARNEPHS